MKQLITILISILFLSCNKKSCNYITDYYQLVYKAEMHYLKNENQEALELLKQAESACGLLNQTGIYEPEMMAELLVKLNREKETFPYLYQYLEEGMKFSYIESNSVFEPLKLYSEWDDLKQDAPEIERQFQNSINTELRDELLVIIKEDQLVRAGDIDFSELNRIDSIHELRIKEIIKTYGYPNYKLVGHGDEAGKSPDIGILFMHFSDTTYFKPILKELIEKGEAPVRILPSMIDSKQRLIDEFTYGIYQNVDSTRIKDFQRINDRRIDVGLRPHKMEKENFKLIRKKYGF